MNIKNTSYRHTGWWCKLSNFVIFISDISANVIEIIRFQCFLASIIRSMLARHVELTGACRHIAGRIIRHRSGVNSFNLVGQCFIVRYICHDGVFVYYYISSLSSIFVVLPLGDAMRWQGYAHTLSITSLIADSSSSSITSGRLFSSSSS